MKPFKDTTDICNMYARRMRNSANKSLLISPDNVAYEILESAFGAYRIAELLASAIEMHEDAL